MKKYALAMTTILLVMQAGCKDEESLPEQGHNGPSIDVQKNMKSTPQLQNHTE